MCLYIVDICVCESLCVCVDVRERLAHWGWGGSVWVCSERAPFNSCVASPGGYMFQKIIYCTSFVYLEKRLKLFVALSSSGWLSVGYHCHLQVPKNSRPRERKRGSPIPIPTPSPPDPREGFPQCTQTRPLVMSLASLK